MKSIYKFLIVIFLAGAVLILHGCGNGEEAMQKAGEFTISLKINPDPPAEGLNTFEVKIVDASGVRQTGLAVHLHYSMPAMAGMPAMADETSLQEVGNGIYRVKIDLGSGGKFPWDVRIEVSKDLTVLAITSWQVTPGTKGIKFTASESGDASQGNIDYYTCTMHPSVKEKGEGTCPICAMNLIPVYKEGEQETIAKGKGASTVSISLYQQQLIGVQRDTVKFRPVQKTIRTVGHVALDESRLAVINLKFSGWVEKLFVNYTGQFVKKGQPLFEIYSPELVSTQEEYLQLFQSVSIEPNSSNSSAMQQLMETGRQRLLLWGVSNAEIKRISDNGKPDIRLTFFSPISGHVIDKQVLEGRHMKAGTDLLTIADLSTVWIHADIYEHELQLIETGQKATIALSYDPKANFIGQVDYIYPTLQKKTRTARVRLVVPNSDLKLKPEMYVDVEIIVSMGEQLTVAATAVLDTGIRQLVFVDKGNGRFEPREIMIGSKVGHYHTVLEGLNEGEVVVKSGNFLIDAEAHVQGVLQTM